MDEILHRFETMVETIVCWYLQGSHHSRVSERCEVESGTHPHGFPGETISEAPGAGDVPDLQSFRCLAVASAGPGAGGLGRGPATAEAHHLPEALTLTPGLPFFVFFVFLI